MQRFAVLILVLLLTVIHLTVGNWYGKRGDEVDELFKRYLQRRIAEDPVKEHHLSDTQALKAIDRLLSQWSRETKLRETGSEPFIK